MTLWVSMESPFLLPPSREGFYGVPDILPLDPHLRFLNDGFEELHPGEFYRALFPVGELDREGEFNKGRYTAIAVRVKSNGKVCRYSVCDDLCVIDELKECDDFCVMSPVSYAGKSQRQANARKLYAVVFDLDGLMTTDDGRSKSLINLFSHIELGLLPKPSHIVFSGTGVHLYYMLEKPLPLFANVLKSLQNYRTCLVPKIWNPYISSLSEKPQYESVTQGFRMVGTIAKSGRTVRAFEVGDKVSVEYLNQFADPGFEIADVKYTSETPKSVAKEKWPEWYQSRIVDGNPRGSWVVKRDLYDWWKRKIESGATVGHRYFCVMALAVYARKCAVPYEELEQDALCLVPFLNALDETGSQPFTAEDVVKALEAYDASYLTFPRHTIEELTGVEIPPSKRNGRKIDQHIAMVNATRKMRRDVFGEDEYRNSGRPSKKDLIRDYAFEHPEANHSEIARALGVSRPTVIKWLKDGEQASPAD